MEPTMMAISAPQIANWYRLVRAVAGLLVEEVVAAVVPVKSSVILR